jgi:post-segregation antitoxin (ccd killing protein)
MKDERKFKAFSIMLNNEESEILRRLRCEYGINISGTIKLILKDKLKKLDELKKLEENE